MAFYRRYLPHIYEIGRPIFLTWRLHGSVPANRAFRTGEIDSGKAFVAMDRLFDSSTVGPRYLAQPAVAEMVERAIRFNCTRLCHYDLHAFAVMPNDVHLLISPVAAVPVVTKSLKSITARRAKTLLGLSRGPFWQHESYDRLVRDGSEFEKIRAYIEWNPVKAGLVSEPQEYRWSSAWAEYDPPYRERPIDNGPCRPSSAAKP